MSKASKSFKFVFPSFEVIAEIKKHFSPTIITSLALKIPFSSFAYPSRGDVLIKVNIRRGDVPKVFELGIGDVYYCITEDAIGFSLRSRSPCLRTEIKIGEVIKGIES